MDVLRTLLAMHPEAVECETPTFGVTPLNAASWWGKPEAVELLLAAGADTEHADTQGWTPLYAAVHASRTQNIRFLLTAGAEPNVSIGRQAEALTPLKHAIERVDEDTIEMLLDAGAAHDLDTLELIRRLGTESFNDHLERLFKVRKIA